jgi:hypothetical protein
LMSVMKASNGIIDSRLKKEWQALNDLINNH